MASKLARTQAAAIALMAADAPHADPYQEVILLEGGPADFITRREPASPGPGEWTYGPAYLRYWKAAQLHIAAQ